MTTEEKEVPNDDMPFDRDGRDGRLMNMVHMANGASSTDNDDWFPVTLCVGGSIITGRMVSVDRWFELNADAITSANDSDSEDKRKALEAYAQLLFNNDGSVPSNPSDPATWPNFIHLKDAAYVTPNGMVPANQNMLWRGQINRVDGWSFHILSAS